MRVTLRRNGKHRVTLLIRHDVDVNLVVRILATTGVPSENQLSRADITGYIRVGLQRNGEEHYWYTHESWNEEEWQARVAWATSQIRRYWPDWAKEITERVSEG